MKRYEVYKQFARGRQTEEDLAGALGLSVRSWRIRSTKHGSKLPLVLKTLDEIEADTLSRDEASERLGVCVRQVNQMMRTWGVSRPLKDYLVTRAVSSVKWEIRKKFAIEFIAGSSTLEDASERAEVSMRQMRRWVADLLDTHFGMVFKDLKDLTKTKRERLADSIEEAEGLEIAKLNVLNEVARGDRAIEEVALERVLSKRTNRKHGNVRGQPGRRPE